MSGYRPQSSSQETVQEPQQAGHETQADSKTSSVVTSDSVPTQAPNTAPSENARVVEIPASGAPGLMIYEGVVVEAPFQVFEEDRSIKVVGFHGNIVMMQMFYTDWDRYRTDRLPPLPANVTADISWDELYGISDPQFFERSEVVQVSGTGHSLILRV